MADTTTPQDTGIIAALRRLLDRIIRLVRGTGGAAGTGGTADTGRVVVPGGGSDPGRIAGQVGAASGQPVGADSVACPVTLAVTVTTRAGNVPVSGVLIEVDGKSVGRSNQSGQVRGAVSACDGQMRLKAIYGNLNARVKIEEFTIEITGINIPARRAQGGQARNFIEKVQDVFGSGEGGFPGDKDFIDSYAGADLVRVPEQGAAEVQVSVRLATLSLDVPYRNQNDSSETVNGVAQSGTILCMPSSAEMQARYWGIQKVTTAANGTERRQNMDRLDVMMRTYERNRRAFDVSTFPRHWQDWGNLRSAMSELAEASAEGSFTVGNGPASASGTENIPSAYATALTGLVARGIPVVTSTYATDGHVMIVIGAVVKHDGQAEWLIMNDPNGTLASTDSVYGTLELTGSVGANGTNAPADVRGVQEALIRTGHYSGQPGAAINSADPNDPTIRAIRAFQSTRPDGVIAPRGPTLERLNARVRKNTRRTYSAVENERNGPNGDRGRHVYYNGGTEGAKDGRFRLKGQAWTSVVEPKTALTTAQIAERLHPGTYQPPPP
ncbi:MAG: hypothetical protein Q4G25_15360 [Paracoccus sp. (in: a-proteobacteria)]|nr:hypothetical protein [Paracoccus sp. (in: a-proteobacteria)]